MGRWRRRDVTLHARRPLRRACSPIAASTTADALDHHPRRQLRQRPTLRRDHRGASPDRAVLVNPEPSASRPAPPCSPPTKPATQPAPLRSTRRERPVFPASPELCAPNGARGAGPWRRPVTPMTTHALRREMVETCRRMNDTGINQGTAGNISVRNPAGFLITPTSLPYDLMEPEDSSRCISTAPMRATAGRRRNGASTATSCRPARTSTASSTAIRSTPPRSRCITRRSRASTT